MRGNANKKTILLIFVIATIIATIITSFSVVTNRTSKIESNVDEAAVINSNWDPSGMGINANEIVAKAVYFANNKSSTTYSAGCIGFTNEVIKAVAADHRN